MKYNYVFFDIEDNEPNGYYSTCVEDLKKMANVQVCSGYMCGKNVALKFLGKIILTRKINEKIKWPLKKILYPLFYDGRFKDNKPICFVFCCYYEKLDYIRYLRKQYPNCRVIKMHRDLIKFWRRDKPEFTERAIDEVFDLLMTYDKNEAKKYSAIWFNEFESKVKVEVASDYPLSDVFFAGRVKDRLPKLMAIYERLTRAGLKVEYYLIGVDKDKRKPLPGITYGDKIMPYRDMLYRTINAKCSLDINQNDAVGYTARFLEAVMYNKKLITDNCSIKDSEFYNPKFIQCINEVSDIDPEFVRGDDVVDYHYVDEFSPIHLIGQIEDALCELEK